MKKILITGGAGFMGSNAALFFQKKGWKIFILDDFSRKGSKNNLDNLKKKITIQWYKVEISNYKRLSNIISKIKPNLILHCAGQVAVTKSVTNPRRDFNSNTLGTFNVLESIRNFSKNSKLIFTSTNKVYGNIEKKISSNEKRYFFKSSEKNINENYPLDFYSPYGCSKGAADQYVRDYSRIYKLDTTVLRLSCIYGGMQYGIEDHGWITWLTMLAIFEKKIKIFGDGKQVRDALYIDDLVKLFYKIAIKKNIKSEIYNVGGSSKNSLSLLELVNSLEKKLKKKVNFRKYNWRPGDQKIYISNISKVSKELNWKPEVEISKGLDRVIEWVKLNQKIIQNTLKI
jgi:CDP-paratose 2-epimerase